MGSGKTSAAINMMNEEVDKKFVFVTQLLAETNRIRKACAARDFIEPQSERSNKLENIQYLLARGKNIASTHALFARYNEEILQSIREQHYVLVLDEVVNVLEFIKETPDDVNDLFASGRLIIDPETRIVKTNNAPYVGKHSDTIEKIESGCVTFEDDKLIVWQMPIELFSAFDEVYVLTYMFKAQLQYLYYKMHNVDVQYIGVVKNGGGYQFTAEPQDYSYIRIPKITFLEDAKLNAIGKRRTALSATWHDNNKHNDSMIQLQKNLYNVFNNRWKESAANTRLWTTFDKTHKELSGNGYASRFLAFNARATNDYSETRYLAYCVNVYYSPAIMNFFKARGFDINIDEHALSDMVQWIWRSAIRNGHPIWIYIPSSRMRQLLKDWLCSLGQRCYE